MESLRIKEAFRKVSPNLVRLIDALSNSETTKYTLRKIKEGKTRPRVAILRFLSQLNGWRYTPVRVMDEDWDYLVVLDACRYDYFKEICNISGKLKKKFSGGTHTVPWIKYNFDDEFPETVYVSSNPQVSKYKLRKLFGRTSPFFHLEEVWDWGFDEELNTVHPRTVTSSAIELSKKYTDKRIIVHYLQPHKPFIAYINLAEDEILEIHERWPVDAYNGTLDVSKVRIAYIDNLKLVLEYVEELIKNLANGKIVVTSDHGECFGEHGIYLHPPNLYIGALIEIPWLEVSR